MKIDGPQLIEDLEGEAIFYAEASDKTMREIGERLTLTVAMVGNFRDALVAIANCQAGLSSHAAQHVLTMSGYCAHFDSKFTLNTSDESKSGWKCSDCGKESDVRLMPFK